MQVSLRRVHAAQGHVFVVAESHLILRRRHPSQARITRRVRGDINGDGRTFEPLVAVVFVDEYIVWRRQRQLRQSKSVLRWTGSFWPVCGTKLISGFRDPWGSSGRDVGSPAIMMAVG
jgi:hypothetical protein